METNFKSYVVIASFLLAFGAMFLMPTSSSARMVAGAGPVIELCPGTGVNCATATTNGTTIKILKGSGQPGGTIQL